jgi:hypothetical protein
MATITEVPRKKGTAYRAQVRRPGYPDQTETFDTRQDAVNWSDGIELDIRLSRVDPKALSEKKYLNDGWKLAGCIAVDTDGRWLQTVYRDIDS